MSVDTPLRTHLGLLEVALTRADQEGVFAAKVSGRRAVLATDLCGLERQGWSTAQFQQISHRRLAAALRRAHADGDRGRNVSIASSDHVARDPLRVPWACYPLEAATCTRLIGDLAWFAVEVSGPGLVEEMRCAGVDAQWVVPDDCDGLRPGQAVIRLRGDACAWDAQRSELDRYLLELIDLPTWIAGLRQVQRTAPLPGHSWPFYRDEQHVWL